MYRYLHLVESPLEAARKKLGLDPAEAAQRLNIPILRLARLENATLRFPKGELERLIAGLEGAPKTYQLSLFDALTERQLLGKPPRPSRKKGGPEA